MENGKIIVGITQGDSNGIGYEVLIKALADPRTLEAFTPVIYGSSKIFAFYRKQIHNLTQPLDTYVVNAAAEAKPKKINIVNCLPDNIYAEPGQPSLEAAKSAITALERAAEDLKNGKIDVLVTAPIHKRMMADADFGYTGHTEFLERTFGAEDAVMMMVSDFLKVAVVTGHLPLKEVPAAITTERILSKLRVLKAAMRRDFGIDCPKIAVLGLNPHCGDGGLLGNEETDCIIPALKQANEEGISAFGPYSPDGFFAARSYARFDVTLAMYHDQGLEPFKAISFETGVNYTAGLPVVRTSPDHGTAYDMAGKDSADPHSMRAAIYTAVDIFKRRAAFDALMAGKMPERSGEPGERQPRQGGKPQIE